MAIHGDERERAKVTVQATCHQTQKLRDLAPAFPLVLAVVNKKLC